ncbi:hypothetical protein [Kribbella qitaiheensis]|uniref:hypothetical protein n=1 Tax=Kribbella qitaiheensis TaxID=1544730 RepID=UPI001FEB66D4|nr:hypothetical protein [Kribbella qitaiheensis]
MNRRPSELRRQVLWLQSVTVAVLIAMVWITLLSRARSQADRDAAATGAVPPSWWDLLQLELRSMLGIGCLMLGVAIAGNALVTWRVRHATRGMGTQSLAWMLDFYEGVLRAGPRRPGTGRLGAPGPAGQRRSPPPPRAARGPARQYGRRAAPTRHVGGAADRRQNGVRRTAPRRSWSPRGEPAARSLRQDRHIARPHPVASAAGRAGRGTESR